MLLIVPSDVLRPRAPDGHFAAEAAAARAAGIDVALVDHDALTTPGGARDAVARVPKASAGASAVYRGWMMSSGQYAAFSDALAERGVMLRTSADQYRQAHELPGWYAALAEATPRSVWTVGSDRGDFEQACRELGPGPAVLRDYSKSMKHHWHEATYIPDLADADAAWAVANRFLNLRGEDFTGGFVLRRFEQFTSAEVRTWWINGGCRLTGPHPDTPDLDPPADLDLSAVEAMVAALGLPFVAVDLARRADGTWRVIELGDGQVSDRPTTVNAETLITALINNNP